MILRYKGIIYFRPEDQNIVLIYKNKMNALFVDFTGLLNHRVKIKESEKKINTYILREN